MSVCPAGVELNREQYFKIVKVKVLLRIILLKVKKIQLIFIVKIFAIFGGCIEKRF